MNKTISVKAYAKLNLFLEITGKRDDGYHLLRSVMQSISLYDVLRFEFTEGNDVKLLSNDENMPLDKKNLVWKAIDAFYRSVDVQRMGVSVYIQKNIPSMAGMAGGSSDAAATLVALNELYGKPLTSEELCEIGATLGADVPFCIVGGTVLCEGVGDILTKLDDIPDCCFAVAKPDIGISTPEAYKLFDNMTITDKPDYKGFKAGLVSGDIKKIADNLYNSLEIACNLDEINEIKSRFVDFGALNSMMTGSGSAVFGIFKDTVKAEYAISQFDDVPFTGVFKPVNKGVEIISYDFE